MLKQVVSLIIVVIGMCIGSYQLGAHTFIWQYNEDGSLKIAPPEICNTQELVIEQANMREAWEELAHHFLYEHNREYWENDVKPTKYYQKLDSIFQGDWEDWYESWEK